MRPSMVSSVGWPAGSITQTARGGCSRSTNSAREDAPTAPRAWLAVTAWGLWMAAVEQPLHHIAARASQAYHA